MYRWEIGKSAKESTNIYILDKGVRSVKVCKNRYILEKVEHQ